MRFLVILFAFVAANASAAGNHCSEQEQVIFSCSLAKSSKVVSICASKILSNTQGSIAYRYGQLGKVELEFPSSVEGSAQKFRYAHYFRYQTNRTEVSFDSGKFTYSIFDYYDGEEKQKYTRGVRVSATHQDGKGSELYCVGKVTSAMQKLEEVIPCDADNGLARCN